ncbi:hypothetical protein LD112_17125 [Pantoea agglomerans]|nr:hypothetical protein [Pantoea agglomerans]
MNAVKEKAAQAAFFVFKVKAQGAYAFHKDAKAPSVAAQRRPSLARDALLQAYAPIALRLVSVWKRRFQRLGAASGYPACVIQGRLQSLYVWQPSGSNGFSGFILR